MPIVLNVGSGGSGIEIPTRFTGWQVHRLDIDPRCNPDVLADARELQLLPKATHDAVYCSHNLEHFYHHDAAKVARGFAHILKPGGFAQITVPDILALARHVTLNNFDVETVLYNSKAGPVTVRDVVYGFQPEIERSGNDFFAHKTCFSVSSLRNLMALNGFPFAAAGAVSGFALTGIFFKEQPSEELCKKVGVAHGSTPL